MIDLARPAARSRCSSRIRPGTPASKPFASPRASGSGTRRPTGTCVPGAAADATHPGGAAGLASPDRLLQRRLPLRRALAARLPARLRVRATRPGGATAQQGDRARQRRPEPVPRRRSTSASSPPASRTTCTASPTGVPTTGPMDRILASHFETEQGADYATTCGSATDCQGELRGRLQPYAIYVPAKPAPAARLRPDPAPALARRQLQPVLGQPQPVPARRAGPGLDRDHPRGPRARRLVLRTRRRRHLRGLGRRRRAATGSTPAGRRSPATRWAATAPTSSPPSSRTCSPGRTRSSGPPGLGVWVPPAAAAAGRRGEQHQPHARLGAQHPVPDLGRRRGRAGARGGRRRPGADLRRSRLPLRVRPVHDRRPLHARDRTTSTRRRRRSSAPTGSTANPPHVSYVVNPKMDFAGSRDGRRPRLLAVRPAAPRLERERAAGQGRRALGGLRSRRPGAEPDPDRARRSLQGGNLAAAELQRAIEDLGRRAADGPKRNVLHLNAQNLARVVVQPGAGASQLPRDSSTSPPTGPLTVTLAGCGRTLHFGARRRSRLAASGARPASSLASCRADEPLPRHLPGDRARGRRRHLRRRLRAPGPGRRPARRPGRDRRRGPVRRLAVQPRPSRLAWRAARDRASPCSHSGSSAPSSPAPRHGPRAPRRSA